MDVIVIGAGPAGSTVAEGIAQSGYEVQMIEKRKPHETKVCGGDISLKLANQLSLRNDDIEKVISHEVLHFPWGTRIRPFKHVTVLREKFDGVLRDRAVTEGAEIRYESRVTNVSRKSKFTHVHFMDLKGGETLSTSCKIVVFADGPLTLAGKTFPSVGFQQTIGNTALAVRYELEWKKNEIDYYELFYGSNISSWGYGWIFPTKNSLNVGVGSLLSTLKESRTRITEVLDRFVKHVKIGCERLKDKRTLKFGAALIPLAPARKIFASSCLVVGDAAGMVDPLGGCGIESAIYAGRLAANVIVEALKHDDFSANFLSRYQALWRQSQNHKIIQRSHRIAQTAIPLSRFDKNLLSKIAYVLHFGKSSLVDIQAMLHPLA